MDDISDPSRFEIESYNMMIDSRRRDVTIETEASEYTVDITATPFKNVVGVELLAASVPRTGYIIDGGFDTFSYVMGSPPYDPANVVTVQITDGDYNLSQICDEINRAVSQVATVGTPVPVASPLTNPAEISNKIAFDAPYPFSVIMDRKTFGGRVGFGVPVTQSGVSAGWFDGTPDWKQKNFIDSNVYVAVATANSSQVDAFIGPEPFSNELNVPAGNTCDQEFTCLATGSPSSVTLSVVSGVSSNVSVSVWLSSDVSKTVIASGSAIVTSTGDFTVSLAPTTPSVVMTQGTVYTFRIAAGGVALKLSINPQNLPYDPASALYLGGSLYSTEDALCATFSLTYTGYRVVSPGVVDLTGDRFLIVRCPEVETYTVRGERLASEAIHPGIGLLALGTYGFTEARLDFFHAKPRTLQTPISRLSKLTIRLESQNGNLYPTRGCDHTLLLCVRTAVPKHVRTPANSRSLLAPGYDPDVWKYRREVETRNQPGKFSNVTSY